MSDAEFSHPRLRSRRRPTIADVARAANVSSMTVSNVVNGRFASMTADTRAAVEKAIAQIGYRPHASGRSLKLARRFATEAASSAGEDPFYWYFSAALAVRENDLATAKGAIGKALTLAPTTAEILFEAGFIANENGESAAARDYWNRAVAADGGGKVGLAAKRALDALGAEPSGTAAR